MKLAWHIVTKDFRRFWLGALLLAGLVGLKLFLLDGVLHNAITGEWERRMRNYQAMLLVAQLIFSFFLAVATVQEDPVPDPGAFWQTLPITRRQLLGAKLLSVILLCVLPPLLALSSGWLVLGLPVGPIRWSLLLLAEAQLALGLLAFAFGSLTKNTAQLLFWILGTGLCFPISKLIVDPLLSLQPLASPEAQFTHHFLLLSIGTITAAAITLNQYLSHAKNRSIIFLGVGFCLSVYVVETLRTRHHFDFTPTLLPALHDLDDEVAHLHARVVQADVAKPKGDSDADVLFRVSLEGNNRGLIINPIAWVGQWGQTETAKLPVWASLYQGRQNWVKRSAGPILHFPSSPAIDAVDFGVESTMPGSDEAVLNSRSTPYEGQIGLNVSKTSLVGRMELVPGATLRSNSGITRIVNVSTDGAVILVDFMGQVADITPDSGWPVEINDLGRPSIGFGLVLVDSKTHAILTPSRGSTWIHAYAYGIDLVHGKYQFVLPPSGSKALTDWVLVVIRRGEDHNLIKSFKENVFLDEVPAIERDPRWLE